MKRRMAVPWSAHAEVRDCCSGGGMGARKGETGRGGGTWFWIGRWAGFATGGGGGGESCPGGGEEATGFGTRGGDSFIVTWCSGDGDFGDDGTCDSCIWTAPACRTSSRSSAFFWPWASASRSVDDRLLWVVGFELSMLREEREEGPEEEEEPELARSCNGGHRMGGCQMGLGALRRE